MGMLDAALNYAERGWSILPLRGKVPLTRHGVKDATREAEVLRSWWAQWPEANIGTALPAKYAVIDVDPRNGGESSWSELEREHGPFPPTVTVLSGRNDGGSHRYVKAPMRERLTSARLPVGIDLKREGGYVLLPPSIHPDTGLPYRFADGPGAPVPMPEWFFALVRVQGPRCDPSYHSKRPAREIAPGESIADHYSATASWDEVLAPHGWTLVAGDGDEDGAQWAHSGATNTHSATTRHGCLFVYSSSTPFEETTDGTPHGYTRFAAYAVLNHRAT
jgi:hypothetical protein